MIISGEARMTIGMPQITVQRREVPSQKCILLPFTFDIYIYENIKVAVYSVCLG